LLHHRHHHPQLLLLLLPPLLRHSHHHHHHHHHRRRRRRRRRLLRLRRRRDLLQLAHFPSLLRSALHNACSLRKAPPPTQQRVQSVASRLRLLRLHTSRLPQQCPPRQGLNELLVQVVIPTTTTSVARATATARPDVVGTSKRRHASQRQTPAGEQHASLTGPQPLQRRRRGDECAARSAAPTQTDRSVRTTPSSPACCSRSPSPPTSACP
jgi:hypothetical protein